MKSTVLVVDDEQIVRVSVRHVLEKHGYGVIEAASGDEALRVLREEKAAVDLVVTDVVMPGMSGVELIQQITASKISLPVIYISGYEMESPARAITGTRDQWMLAKPFFPAGLMSAVQRALASRS